MARHRMEVDIYPDPNPALTAILVGPELKAAVIDKTHQVVAVYTQKLANRPRKGDRHPGNMLRHTKGVVDIGGYRKDRWVGEVSVKTAYAAADELGRKQYNPYQGSHDLQESLYSVLPYRI
ncbi:neck protein [Mycobacterium phage Kumao]|uniref:Uncharacterized protein n=1 Tax=Mycobacterium phage Kumao TaxID=2041344 RepID=A0A2D1GPW6_9CAUD|nr:neck protein [Mycobacterium phage Kumao]ATN93983.1 hypothetical protein SEA_KUMAO_20 [Mycobacterium phage Kumao]